MAVERAVVTPPDRNSGAIPPSDRRADVTPRAPCTPRANTVTRPSMLDENTPLATFFDAHGVHPSIYKDPFQESFLCTLHVWLEVSVLVVVRAR